MFLSFIADLLGLILGYLVNLGFVNQSVADVILSKFVMPIDDDMAL